MTNIIDQLDEGKKKKPYNNLILNAGNVDYNVDMFNKINSPGEIDVNPMNGVIGMAEALIEDSENNDLIYRVQAIDKNGEELDQHLDFTSESEAMEVAKTIDDPLVVKEMSKELIETIGSIDKIIWTNVEDLEEGLTRSSIINELQKLGKQYNFNRFSDSQLFRLYQKELNKPTIKKEEGPMEIEKEILYCPQCKHQLTDGGECPVCDLGDEEERDSHTLYDMNEGANYIKVTHFDSLEQLRESLLMEGPIDNLKDKWASKAGVRASKSQEKAERAANRQELVLVNRDFGGKGRNWTFKLKNKNGEYVDYTQAQWINKFADWDRQTTPPALLAQAIVVDSKGYYVRRGTENFEGKRFKFVPGKNDTIAPGYQGSAAMEAQADIDPLEAQEQAEAKKKRQEAAKKAAATRKGKAAKAVAGETPATGAETPEAEVKTEEPASKSEVAKSGDKTSATKSAAGRYDIINGISDNTIGHFRKLVQALKPTIYDAFDKPISTSYKDLKNMTAESLIDYKIEIDGKKIPVIDWLKKAVKNKIVAESLITEAPIIKLNNKDLYNPSEINFKDKIKDAEEEEERLNQEVELNKQKENLKAKYEADLVKLHSIINTKTTVERLTSLGDILATSNEGPADNLAGELIRAMNLIIYRFYNDGDFFYESYGFEVCKNSAAFLMDYSEEFFNQFSNILSSMIDRDDDDRYETKILDIADNLISLIFEDYELAYTPNTVDNFTYVSDTIKYIEEHRPTYEFEISVNDDVRTLLDHRVIDSWDVISYLEDQLSYESAFEGVEIARPWGYHDTSYTLTNLTKDGYETIERWLDRPMEDISLWDDLIEEHIEELKLIQPDYDDEEFDEEYPEEDLGATNEELIEEGLSEDEASELFRLAKEIGIKSGYDFNHFQKNNMDVEACEDSLNAFRRYRDELGDDFEIDDEM